EVALVDDTLVDQLQFAEAVELAVHKGPAVTGEAKRALFDQRAVAILAVTGDAAKLIADGGASGAGAKSHRQQQQGNERGPQQRLACILLHDHPSAPGPTWPCI